MMKRMIPLLGLAMLLLLIAAPDAEASCWRCSAGQQKCVYVYHPAWHSCVWNPSIGFCDLESECDPYGLRTAAAPLASEFRVVSVERIAGTAAPRVAEPPANDTTPASIITAKNATH